MAVDRQKESFDNNLCCFPSIFQWSKHCRWLEFGLARDVQSEPSSLWPLATDLQGQKHAIFYYIDIFLCATHIKCFFSFAGLGTQIPFVSCLGPSGFVPQWAEQTSAEVTGKTGTGTVDTLVGNSPKNGFRVAKTVTFYVGNRIEPFSFLGCFIGISWWVWNLGFRKLYERCETVNNERQQLTFQTEMGYAKNINKWAMNDVCLFFLPNLWLSWVEQYFEHYFVDYQGPRMSNFIKVLSWFINVFFFLGGGGAEN